MPKTVSVRAEETAERQYSDVMTDLRKSESFTEMSYPANDEDYSVQLITIAESNKNELFLYVYQPSHNFLDLKCTKVSIHVGFSPDGQNLDPTLYDLELLSTSSVFDKYLVKGLAIPNEECHYYNIIALYREVSALVDGTIENGTTDGKSFDVGEQWCCYVKDGALVYEKSTFTTSKITSIINGHVFYEDGFRFSELFSFQDSGCYSHFLAFNIEDYDVRHIYDASLSYSWRERTAVSLVPDNPDEWTINPSDESYTDTKVMLLDKEKVTYEGKGLCSSAYKWERIMSSTEFIDNFEDQNGILGEDIKNKVKKCQYVFCYHESAYQAVNNPGTIGYVINYTEIKDVTTLTLHFLDAQLNEYNLGVVSDITSPDLIVDGVAKPDADEWWEKLIAILGAILIVKLVSPFISPICFGLGVALKYVLKGISAAIKAIFGILTIPFKIGNDKGRKRW